MDFKQIRALLRPDEDVDLEALHDAFLAEDLDGGMDRFVLYLHQLGHLDASGLAWVSDAEAVSIIRSDALHDSVDVAAPQAELEPDNLTLLETVGAGASGSVSLARDRTLHRYVAYKQLHDAYRVHEDVIERFDFEAQVTAQLDHPNIVPVYTYLRGRGYSMKLVAGRTLTELIRDARRATKDGAADDDHSLDQMLEVFLKVCDAVHYAHSKGVVHRDLKPANIMVGRFNEVYVVDWGIAKLMAAGDTADRRLPSDDSTWVAVDTDSDSPLTLQGELLGSPGYMSPEQARSEHAVMGPASDIYSLGIILHEIVNLERAFQGSNVVDTVTRAARGEMPPMTTRRVQGTAAGELGAIITRACEPAPEDRYPSAEALADDVRHFMRGQELKARPDGPVQRIVRWVGHHREATLGMLATLVLLGAGVVMASVYERQRATIAAQEQQERVTDLAISVAAQAQRLERHFLTFESTVEGLAAAAGQVLLNGQPTAEPIYRNADYDQPATAPPDLTESRAYGRAISLDHAVAKLAPDVTPETVAPKLARLGPLRHWFRQTLFEQAGGPGWRSREAEVRQQILDQGSALTWAYVGLASGIHFAYPGKGQYPVAYDPRQRPWYRLSADGDGRTWLAPYVDVGGRGLVIPCTRPIRSPNGELLGVAGVEMTLDHVRSTLAEAITGPVRAAYLVDARGRVAAGTGDVPQRFALGTLIADLADLEPFPDQAVVEAIGEQRSGHLKRSVDGNERLLVYQRLASVGWYLVVEAEVNASG